jgi:hypothetical protein
MQSTNAKKGMHCQFLKKKKLFQHYQTGTTRIGFLPRRTSHSMPFPGRPRCGLFKSLLDSHLSWYQVPLISMILLLHCDYQYYYDYYVHIYIYVNIYITYVYIYSICMLYLYIYNHLFIVGIAGIVNIVNIVNSG